MKPEQEQDAIEGAEKPKTGSGHWHPTHSSQRPWTQRLEGRLQYVRFTGRGYDGNQHIFFQFNLPSGQTKLDQPVFDILQEMKHLSRPWGGNPCPTGLRCVTSREYPNGTLWQLPLNEVGATAADVIDGKLRDLAATLEQGHDPGHHR
jgi:hypothetical protein